MKQYCFLKKEENQQSSYQLSYWNGNYLWVWCSLWLFHISLFIITVLQLIIAVFIASGSCWYTSFVKFEQSFVFNLAYYKQRVPSFIPFILFLSSVGLSVCAVTPLVPEADLTFKALQEGNMGEIISLKSPVQTASDLHLYKTMA